MNPLTSRPVAAPPLASQLANTLTDALVRGEAALRSLAGAPLRGPSRPGGHPAHHLRPAHRAAGNRSGSRALAGPPTAAYPPWGPRIVRGAWWRSQLNLAFLEAVRIDLVGHRSAA